MKKETVKINTEFIKLDQLLKFSQTASTGSEAKDMILSGIVSFNGAPCIMRGKKIRAGDEVRVDFEDETLLITVED